MSMIDELPRQAVNDDRVELRHFTIIDEARYMLGFENKPLQNLIAVGRNKGMIIILATQNMESFKSRYFDFYANAQYPLIRSRLWPNSKVGLSCAWLIPSRMESMLSFRSDR